MQNFLCFLFSDSRSQFLFIGVLVRDIVQEIAIFVQSGVVLAHMVRNLLEMLRHHAIFSVQEVDQHFARCSHSAIIFDHEIFQRLDQTSLDIACVCSFDSRIDQSFAPAHRVEVKLGRSQASQVRTRHETFRFRSVIVLGKVR